MKINYYCTTPNQQFWLVISDIKHNITTHTTASLTIYFFDDELEIFDSYHHQVSKISYLHWDFWHSFVVPVEVLPDYDRDFCFSLWQHKFVVQTIGIMADNGSCPPPCHGSGTTKRKSRNTSPPPHNRREHFVPCCPPPATQSTEQTGDNNLPSATHCRSHSTPPSSHSHVASKGKNYEVINFKCNKNINSTSNANRE